MKHINKLLIQLRKERNPRIFSALCFIERDSATGKWIANPTLWDGKPLSGHMEGVIPEEWVSTYDTAEEAAEAVSSLFNTLDIKHKPVILIDDIAG